MQEIWKDIKDYEGYYQVSNSGKIKSLSRFIEKKQKKSFIRYYTKEKIIKIAIGKTGYYVCSLFKNGKGKTFKVHRLVAQAFIDNPSNYPIINHKDCNKLNNNVNNLEWCTYSYNNKDAYDKGLKENNRKSIKKINKNKRKPVLQYDINDNFIKRWNYIQEVEKELNICHINITKCCKGERMTAGGYKWRYETNN